MLDGNLYSTKLNVKQTIKVLKNAQILYHFNLQISSAFYIYKAYETNLILTSKRFANSGCKQGLLTFFPVFLFFY